MEIHEPENQRNGRKLLERVALWIVIACGVAAVVWRVIQPWIRTPVDLVFIGIFAVGITCLGLLGFFRRPKK